MFQMLKLLLHVIFRKYNKIRLRYFKILAYVVKCVLYSLGGGTNDILEAVIIVRTTENTHKYI